MKTVISSGHALYVRGASGFLDEVDEARRVSNRVGRYLGATVLHDDVSKDQSSNLSWLVNAHNAQERELDVSVHFNAFETCDHEMGCEVLYVTQEELATEVAYEICSVSGLKNRGAKKRTDLFFLNETAKPAILIEVCFVDSSTDAEIYRLNFGPICSAIARTLFQE